MKPKPTPKKLPSARVSASMTNGLFSVRRSITAKGAIPVAVVPTHTAAQARTIDHLRGQLESINDIINPE